MRERYVPHIHAARLRLVDLYAVTAGGGFYHFDGASWTALNSGTQEHLRDVHVLPNGNVYVVGENGTFFVYVP